jgi:RNA polymerase sigma-70 factor (ECF subfamily)
MEPTDPDASDRSLLERFRGGTGDAATLLYFRYAEQLRSLAAARLAPDLAPRVDADDIVQSVFRTFFRRAALGQFEVPHGEDLWKLFLVIALNKVRSAATYHRAAKRDVSRTPELDAATEPDGRGADALATLRITVEELLAELPDPQRAIVEARVAGYEVDDIAARVGCSKRSVERCLQKFRARLSAVLEDRTDDPPPDAG